MGLDWFDCVAQSDLMCTPLEACTLPVLHLNTSLQFEQCGNVWPHFLNSFSCDVSSRRLLLQSKENCGNCANLFDECVNNSRTKKQSAIKLLNFKKKHTGIRNWVHNKTRAYKHNCWIWLVRCKSERSSLTHTCCVIGVFAVQFMMNVISATSEINEAAKQFRPSQVISRDQEASGIVQTSQDDVNSRMKIDNSRFMSAVSKNVSSQLLMRSPTNLHTNDFMVSQSL